MLDIEQANADGKGNGKLFGSSYRHDLHDGETESNSACETAQPHPVYERIYRFMVARSSEDQPACLVMCRFLGLL